MRVLDGVRVVELADERTALAGKLLADMGAEVIVVEPPGGAASRGFGPFAGDEDDPERSLWWWHYNTSKRSVVLDSTDERDRVDLQALLLSADVVIEGLGIDGLAAIGLDADELCAENDRLVWTSITHDGRANPQPPMTDLTLLAEGGPVWSCGYDDASIPPVRGGGNQGFHTGCHYAAVAILIALHWREDSGRGQIVDVSMLMAANATTEFATIYWLNAQTEIYRQTGRHAHHSPTEWTQIECRDGRWLNTGVPPRRKAEFQALRSWVDELGLTDSCPTSALLELGDQYEQISILSLDEDPLAAEVFQAGRATIEFLAEHLDAQDLFAGLQGMGMACGVINSPEEMMADPHFVDRGFPVEIEAVDGSTYTAPGAPYLFGATPWATRRAPALGEDQPLLDDLPTP